MKERRLPFSVLLFHGAVGIALLCTPLSAAGQEQSPCEVVSCSGHGQCLMVRGEPACACEEGYAPDEATHLNCVPLERSTTLSDGSQPLVAVSTDGQSRALQITSTPPGARFALDNIGPAQQTPSSRSIGRESHFIVLDMVGYERAVVLIPEGETDLHLDVQLSRPVFEAGIGLVAVGGAAIISSIVLLALAIGDEEDEGGHGIDDDMGVPAAIVGGVGISLVPNLKR